VHRKRARKSRGFTITECVVAIVVLGIAVPPMMYALRAAHRHRVNAILPSRARWLATEKLEDITADRHSTTRGYTYLASANYPAESSITGYPGFTRSVAFNVTGADLVSAGSGYKKATVTVSWTDATGTARSLALSTVLTDYTP
jgi:prepilin-type N-terminal cleavage/methylation domain-containing protein